MVKPSTTRKFRAKRGRENGFTLLELIIVMAIVAILASVAIPRYLQSLKKAKEAVLKQDLWVLRNSIDSYTVDKEKGPQTLEDLVQGGYIREVPKDPMTSRNDTWMTGQSQNMTTIMETSGGIDDVHSGAQGLATDGSSYNTW